MFYNLYNLNDINTYLKTHWKKVKGTTEEIEIERSIRYSLVRGYVLTNLLNVHEKKKIYIPNLNFEKKLEKRRKYIRNIRKALNRN